MFDPVNQGRIKKALEILPDKAIREFGDEDFRDYLVVRVSDEILVDVMTSACGVEYEEASRAIDVANVRRFNPIRNCGTLAANEANLSRK